jgi:hypothetical protein
VVPLQDASDELLTDLDLPLPSLIRLDVVTHADLLNLDRVALVTLEVHLDLVG